MKLAFVSMIPVMLLCGCAFTGEVIHRGTKPVTLHRQERVDRVEKAVVTQEGNLVALLHGKMAGAPKAGLFSITIPQSGSNATPAKLEEVTAAPRGHVTVPRSSVIEGWPKLEGTDSRPIAIETVLLPGHQRAVSCPDKFPGIRNADRTLYVVWNKQHDPNLEFVYVLQGPNPQRTFFSLEPKHEVREHKYSLLLLVPVAFVGDVVMLPVWAVAWLSGWRG